MVFGIPAPTVDQLEQFKFSDKPEIFDQFMVPNLLSKFVLLQDFTVIFNTTQSQVNVCTSLSLNLGLN